MLRRAVEHTTRCERHARPTALLQLMIGICVPREGVHERAARLIAPGFVPKPGLSLALASCCPPPIRPPKQNSQSPAPDSQKKKPGTGLGPRPALGRARLPPSPSRATTPMHLPLACSSTLHSLTQGLCALSAPTSKTSPCVCTICATQQLPLPSEEKATHTRGRHEDSCHSRRQSLFHQACAGMGTPQSTCRGRAA